MSENSIKTKRQALLSIKEGCASVAKSYYKWYSRLKLLSVGIPLLTGIASILSLESEYIKVVTIVVGVSNLILVSAEAYWRAMKFSERLQKNKTVINMIIDGIKSVDNKFNVLTNGGDDNTPILHELDIYLTDLTSEVEKILNETIDIPDDAKSDADLHKN